MRIGIVTQGYQSAGGVQAVARWLVEELRSNGDECTVFNVASSFRDTYSRRLLAPSSWKSGPQMVKDPEENVVQVGVPLAELEPLRYLPSRELREALRQFDAVVVVAGAPALSNVALRSGVRTVLQVATRASWERESILKAASTSRRSWGRASTWVVSRMEVRALKRMDAVLVENPEMGDELRRVAPQTTVEIAPPGIDCARYAKAGPWAPDGPIVSVGRLAEARKGWGRMFIAYAHLCERFPDAPRLVIGGRGDLSRADMDVLQELRVRDRIDIHRDMSLEELRDVLHQGSVFWQTSYEEGLGIAAIEAMAAGLPVVATSTSGTEMSIVDGETGFLVPQDEDRLPRAFSDATLRILHELGEDMARAGVERTRTVFDSNVTFKAFVAAIRGNKEATSNFTSP